jgi:YD repeat-containing protein
MFKPGKRSFFFLLLVLILGSCEKDGISTRKEQLWLETIQNDTGSGLIKAIWEEHDIGSPLFSFEYNDQDQLIKRINKNGSWTEYDYTPDGRISKRNFYHSRRTCHKYDYKYDDHEETIIILASQVIEWGDECPAENQYYYYDSSKDRMVCEVKIDVITGFDSYGNEICVSKLVFKAEFKLLDNSILEMSNYSLDEFDKLIYVGSSTYEYDDKVNPLFQSNFPPLDRGMYQFGEHNITTVIGGMERLDYSYQYNGRGLPFKRSREGKKSWYYQYY